MIRFFFSLKDVKKVSKFLLLVWNIYYLSIDKPQVLCQQISYEPAIWSGLTCYCGLCWKPSNSGRNNLIHFVRGLFHKWPITIPSSFLRDSDLWTLTNPFFGFTRSLPIISEHCFSTKKQLRSSIKSSKKLFQLDFFRIK